MKTAYTCFRIRLDKQFFKFLKYLISNNKKILTNSRYTSLLNNITIGPSKI